MFAGGHDDISVDLKQLHPLTSKEKASVVESFKKGSSANETENQWKFYL